MRGKPGHRRVVVLHIAAVVTVLGGLLTTWAGVVRWQSCRPLDVGCPARDTAFYYGQYTGGWVPDGFAEPLVIGAVLTASAVVLLAGAGGRLLLGLVSVALAPVACYRFAPYLDPLVDPARSSAAEPVGALALAAAPLVGLVGLQRSRRAGDEIGVLAWAAATGIGVVRAASALPVSARPWGAPGSEPVGMWTVDGIALMVVGSALVWCAARRTTRGPATAGTRPPGGAAAGRRALLLGGAVAVLLGGMLTTWAGAIRWEHCWGSGPTCATMGDQFHDGAFTGGVPPQGVDESFGAGAVVTLVGIGLLVAAGAGTRRVARTTLVVTLVVMGGLAVRALLAGPDAALLNANQLLLAISTLGVVTIVGVTLIAESTGAGSEVRDRVRYAAGAGLAAVGMTTSLWLVYVLPQTWADSWDDPTWMYSVDGTCTVLVGLALVWAAARLPAPAVAPATVGAPVPVA